jgi:iron(III) transport system ATP-binding protein
VSSAAAVRIQGLSKSFGESRVLEDVSLDVPDGAVTAVLGVSGSGKTTLLRVLAGFERGDAGTVAIFGRIVEGPGVHVRAERRSVGYVAQEGSLFPHLTVRGNVAFGLPMRQRRSHRVDELLEMVGLGALARRYPHELSGGQQQRVALARSLATSPRLVLLDEPFASLDANLRAAVRSDVFRILRDAGTPALLVTHDQDEALSSADLVAVLRDGVIVQSDAPRDLYEHPVDPDVARFVGEANLVAGTVNGATVVTALGTVPLCRPNDVDAGGEVVVLVRPEQLALVGSPEAPSGRVLATEFHGHDTTVRIAPEDHSLPAQLVARVPGSFDPGPSGRAGLAGAGRVVAWSAAAAGT